MAKQEILDGIAASPGISIGKIFLLHSEDYVVFKGKINKTLINKEVQRFRDALTQAKEEIKKIQRSVSEDIGADQGQIFTAHVLVLEDTTMIDEVIQRIHEERLSAEYVFMQVFKKYINTFLKIDDEYLRERIADINDVGKRILKHLIGAPHNTLSDLTEKVIVVAYDLSPSDTATMHKKNVIGFATDIGGKTSHTAIMAKSLEIPAVVGIENVTQRVTSGDTIIIDGVNGRVVINPRETTLKAYKVFKENFERVERGLLELKNKPTKTLDGKKIRLRANIEFSDDVDNVADHGARGIGLYRTEYFYMNRNNLPSEDEQFEAYKEVAKKVAPSSVTIRTIDIGGDKFLSQLSVPREMKPFLGSRAIRFCLAMPDIFKVQLRAIIRASYFGKIRVMYPMISNLDELRAANKMLKECQKELKNQGVPFDPNMEVGAMIEVPSAALITDILAKEVSFFSIGTNDLIQYTLAVDRVNEKMAYLYEPAHPAMLRIVKHIIDNGHSNGIAVAMCGEMAGDPELVPILLGLGLDEFSTSMIIIPEIKKIICNLSMEQAKIIADKALKFKTGAEVKKFARKKLQEIAPELLFDTMLKSRKRKK